MKHVLCLLKLSLLLLISDGAYAIDLQPGEITAPKANVNFIQMSYQNSTRGDKYVKGHKQISDSKIDTAQYLVRLGHTFDINQYPAVFYLQVPVHSNIKPSGSLSNLESDKGLGDTSFLLGLWPYSNHESETYLAIGAYLTVPTGSYDNNRLINIGENRFKTAMQIAYQKRLFDQAHFNFAFDAVKFGSNDAFTQNNITLEQKSLYTAQTGAMYHIDSTYSVGGVYFYTAGGETIRNDRKMDDMTRLQRYQITGIANFSFGRLTLQYGGDIKTENGYFEESRWIFRYTSRF